MSSSAQSAARPTAYATGFAVAPSSDGSGHLADLGIPAGGTTVDLGGLSARDAAILDFERQWWRFSGAKEQSVRETFDMTPAHYHQVLSALLESPDALAYDPILVKRLLRLRDARHQARSARRVTN